MNDFSARTINALSRKGITVMSAVALPGSGGVAFADGSIGYNVNDNGTGRVWTWQQVTDAAR